MKCSYCGEEIEDGLEVCPYCNGEVGKEIKEPPADKENNEAKATVKKVTPADKNDEPPTPKVNKVKAPGRGMLVGMGAVCVVMLVGLIVMSVLFIKTNNELAEAKDSVGRLEYQLAAAQSASSSGNGQVDTSALPPAPASYKGVSDGVSWEAYKYDNTKCLLLTEAQEDGFGTAKINIKFKDANGGLLAAKSESPYGIAKGKKIPINISDSGDFFDIEVSVGDKSNFAKNYSDIAETHVIRDKKVVVDITNKGESKPSSAYVYAIFRKEGKVVYYGSTSSSSLEAGSSEAKEISCFKDFDDVEVLLNAYTL